jgi:2'-5' RNA ligase
MRLFFAITLPDEIRAALAGLQPPAPERDYRWVGPDTMHVTLAFLGEQPADRLDLLATIGQAAASRVPPARLRLGQPGTFGSRQAPRALWVGLSGEVPALISLHQHLAEGLRSASFPVEAQRYQPHITLARRRPRASGGPPPGWPPTPPSGASFAMDTLTLFESRLSPRGPTYLPLQEHRLTARAH